MPHGYCEKCNWFEEKCITRHVDCCIDIYDGYCVVESIKVEKKWQDRCSKFLEKESK